MSHAWAWAFHWEWLIAGVVGAILFVGFVLFPLLLCVVALWEKLRLTPVTRVGDVPADSPIVQAALAERFQPLGLYSDGDKGIKESKMSWLLSDDGAILLRIAHSRLASRHCFISRLPSGRWLVTSSILGVADLSGLEEEEMLREVPLPVLLQRHHQRLAAAGEVPIPFTPDGVMADLAEHWRRRFAIMIERHLVRRRGDAADVFSYTLRGAIGISWGSLWRRRGSAPAPAAVPAPPFAQNEPTAPPAPYMPPPIAGASSDMAFDLAVSAATDTAVAVAPPPPDMMETATLAELDRLQNKRSGWAQGAVILVVSLVVFVAAARSQGESFWSGQSLMLICAILFVHELGHYIAMRLFGYRNLRMFFIPLFGAAVSGQQYNVAGWKRVIVSMAGPLPGIGLGIGLGITGSLLHRNFLVHAATMALIVNGLNLLPILPFDGGWIVHTILFARNRMLDIAFRLVAACALIFAGYKMSGSFLQYIGMFTLLSLPAAYKRAKLSEQLCRDGLPSMSRDAQTIPPDVTRAILARLRQESPRTLQPKAAAQQVVGIFESLNAHPPGALASVGFLGLHGGAFLAAAIFAIVFVVANRPLAAPGSLGVFDLSPAAVASTGAPPAGDYHTLVVRFSSDDAARAAFDKVRSAGDGAVATQAGRVLMIAYPAGNTAVRDKWSARWRRRSSESFIERPGYIAIVSLTCAAPSPVRAALIEQEADAYFHCGVYGAISPPWAPPEDYPLPQRSADMQARLLVRKAQNCVTFKGQEYTQITDAIRAAGQRADTPEVTRLRQQLDAAIQTARQRSLEDLKTQNPGSPVLDAWLKTQPFTDPSTRPQGVQAELAAHLGLWPAGKDPGRLATSGGLGRKDCTLTFYWVTFNHVDQGLPALVRWLEGQQCAQFKCTVMGLPSASSQEEGELE